MPKPRKEEVEKLYELLSKAGLSVIERAKVAAISRELPL
jgi:hypothetical protein